jgi:hypothetical protein
MGKKWQLSCQGAETLGGTHVAPAATQIGIRRRLVGKEADDCALRRIDGVAQTGSWCIEALP